MCNKVWYLVPSPLPAGPPNRPTDSDLGHRRHRHRHWRTCPKSFPLNFSIFFLSSSPLFDRGWPRGHFPRVSPPERSKAVSSPPLSALPKTFQRIISPNSKFAAFALDTNNSRMNFSVFVGESRTSQPARPLPPPSPVCGGLSTSRPPCLPPSCPLVCLTNRDDSKALGPLLSRTLFHTTLYLLLKSPKCLFQFVN